jgi:hypothetical protein
MTSNRRLAVLESEPSEQLALIERLVHEVHQKTVRQRQEFGEQLELTAADPEIQPELQT